MVYWLFTGIIEGGIRTGGGIPLLGSCTVEAIIVQGEVTSCSINQVMQQNLGA